MRTSLIIFIASMFLFTTSAIQITAQQSNDLQKEIELIKKADKKIQYSVSKCAKDMKVLNQKMDENLKSLNAQATELKTNLDTLNSHFSTFKSDVTKKQDDLTAKVKTLSIRLWLCVLVLLIIAAYIFFGVIGAIKKNRLTFEAKMLNDKEAFEHAIKKTEKEFNDKLHLLEQQLAGMKK